MLRFPTDPIGSRGPDLLSVGRDRFRRRVGSATSRLHPRSTSWLRREGLPASGLARASWWGLFSAVPPPRPPRPSQSGLSRAAGFAPDAPGVRGRAGRPQATSSPFRSGARFGGLYAAWIAGSVWYSCDGHNAAGRRRHRPRPLSTGVAPAASSTASSTGSMSRVRFARITRSHSGSNFFQPAAYATCRRPATTALRVPRRRARSIASDRTRDTPSVPALECLGRHARRPEDGVARVVADPSR